MKFKDYLNEGKVFNNDVLSDMTDEVRDLDFIAVNVEDKKSVEFNLTREGDFTDKEFKKYLKDGIEDLTNKKVKNVEIIDKETVQVFFK